MGRVAANREMYLPGKVQPSKLQATVAGNERALGADVTMHNSVCVAEVEGLQELVAPFLDGEQ